MMIFCSVLQVKANFYLGVVPEGIVGRYSVVPAPLYVDGGDIMPAPWSSLKDFWDLSYGTYARFVDEESSRTCSYACPN